MFRQRHHIAIALLTLGLVLLGVFLWLFLKKTWEDEASRLRRETNLLFVNAVQSIERKMFDQLIIRRVDGGGGDTTVSISLRLPASKHKPDSAGAFAFIQERSIETGMVINTIDTSNAKMKFVLNTDRPAEKPEMSGTLSMFMDSAQQIHSGPFYPTILKSLELNFGKAIQEAGLPVVWEVIRPDSFAFNEGQGGRFMAGNYTDILSGEQLGIEISDYQGYLFKQISPQILFSILLFACVGLAFLFVYQSFRKQLRLTEIKNDFIRNMTHELKTPISTVSVAIEAMQNFDALADPARTREYLAISQLELNRLTLLVDKVLRMSLFEQGDPELKTESIDLRAMVEEVLAAMKLQFEKYRGEVSFSFSGTDFLLRGDRLHLVSVLYNLLENALKYSVLPPKIMVHLTHSESQLTLKVSDRGRGIPTEYQGRIFEKFFRVPTGDVHDVKGHGLGLNYVAGVVRLHQGSIEVESKEGVGTTFIVKLPTSRV